MSIGGAGNVFSTLTQNAVKAFPFEVKTPLTVLQNNPTDVSFLSQGNPLKFSSSATNGGGPSPYVPPVIPAPDQTVMKTDFSKDMTTDFLNVRVSQNAFILNNKSHFNTWKNYVLLELRILEWEHLVNPSLPPPRVESLAVRRNLELRCQALIVSRLNNEDKIFVGNCVSPREVWEKLSNKYAPQFSTVKLNISTMFHSLKFNPGAETGIKFVQRFEEIKRKAADYGIDTSLDTCRTVFLNAVRPILPAIEAFAQSHALVGGATVDQLTAYFLSMENMDGGYRTSSNAQALHTSGGGGKSKFHRKFNQFSQSKPFSRNNNSRPIPNKRFQSNNGRNFRKTDDFVDRHHTQKSIPPAKRRGFYNNGRSFPKRSLQGARHPTRDGCVRCGDPGHLYQNCTNPKWLCYNCNQLTDDHEARNCPNRKNNGKNFITQKTGYNARELEPVTDHVNYAHQIAMNQLSAPRVEDPSATTTMPTAAGAEEFGLAALHIAQPSQGKIKIKFLLDSGASLHLCKDKRVIKKFDYALNSQNNWGCK